ncbi:WD40 repeat-like protein [Meredithblackwellia eburnea MCA 4105]
MNFELQNPFAQSFPEGFDSSIEAFALCARFNPRGVFAGHFLAVGRIDGAVSVLDFETRGVVRWLEGHVRAVTTLCWSRNSRYLLTASRDWNAIIWDLSSSASQTDAGERRDTVRFDGPITSAHLHPRNSKMLVVTLQGQVQPVFVDLRTEGGRWNLEPIVEEDEEDEDDEDDGSKKNRELATIARFNPAGDLIYVGTSRGSINIFDVETKECLWAEYIGAASTIKHLEFDEEGKTLVINSNDRCIRVIRLMDEEPLSDQTSPPPEDASPPPARPPRIPWFSEQHKFQDLVGRTSWNGCAFSRDGEYIIGGAGHKGSHNIYVWDRESGGLLKILEGPKDPLEDLDWHPIRPLIASVSSLGLIHVWTTSMAQNWGAYAPGFEELDENLEYPEKEDEFDIEDETVLKRRKAGEQDRPVDILSVPRTSRSSKQPGATATNTLSDTYEDWVKIEADEDDSVAFYPAPELDEVYEGDPEPPEIVVQRTTNGDHKDEDTGNVSEELGMPEEEVVMSHPRRKKARKAVG